MISPKLLPVVFLLLTALLVPFASGCASRDGKTYSDGDVRKSEGQRIEVPPKPTTESDRRDQRRLDLLAVDPALELPF